jgi:hypothetical protein
MTRLAELGFAQDDYGQWHAQGCRVTLYDVMGEWEVDIKLPNGAAIGFDVPMDKVTGRSKAEIDKACMERKAVK